VTFGTDAEHPHQIPGLSNKSYVERLKVLNLPTLKYRRYRGDMIELFKILKGIYDPSCVPQFDLVQLSEENIRTRGNNYKLIQHHCHYDLRQESSARLTNQRVSYAFISSTLSFHARHILPTSKFQDSYSCILLILDRHQ